eukprot:93244_1
MFVNSIVKGMTSLCGSNVNNSYVDDIPQMPPFYHKSDYRIRVVQAYIHQLKLLLGEDIYPNFPSSYIIMIHIPDVISKIIELFYDKYQIFNYISEHHTQLPKQIYYCDDILYTKDFNHKGHPYTDIDLTHKNEIKSVTQSLYNDNHQIVQLNNNVIFKKHVTTPTFKKISYFKSKNINIVHIDCGKSHTLFLASNGNVYSMGDNKGGQCGVIKTKQGIRVNDTFIKKPTLIKTFVKQNIKIKTFSCGESHNCCIDKNNKVWMFGKNTSNECTGILSTAPNNWIYLPQKHKSFNDIVKVKCGNDFTIILNKDGDCYGLGNINNTNISNNKVKDIYVGYEFFVWVTNSNKIYSILNGLNSKPLLHDIDNNDYHVF